MNVISKLGNAVANKYSAFGAAVMVPVLAHAAEGDVWADAVTEISGLKTGVIAVGGVILGIAVASVGFFVIRRLVQRA